MDAAVADRVVRLESPYRGIEEFRYIDEPIFFGRDDDARDLLRLIMMYRGVLVFGDSGVGKSSLLNAKLMPRATRGGYAPERVRVQLKKDAEFIIERTVLDDNATMLPTIFGSDADGSRISLSAHELIARTTEASQIVEEDGPPNKFPLLIFDQFEEFVTLAEELPRAAREEARAAGVAIENALLTLLRDSALCVKVVFVFREDYYAKLSKFFSSYPNLTDHALRIEPLHVRELYAILRGPFEMSGVSFDTELPNEVTAHLEEEFKKRSDSDLINLTEVQIAALRLWQHKDPRTLLREQNVDGLLQSYFTEAIDAMAPELREPAVTLLGRMVTSSGTRNVVSMDDLMATAKDEGISFDIAERALADLEKVARVVRRERRNEVVVYEILSEYLVPWIRFKKAEAAAKKRQREEEHRRRKLDRTIQIGAAVALLFLIGVLLIQSYRNSQTELSRRLQASEKQYDLLKKSHDKLEEEVLRLQQELTRVKADITNERRLHAEATIVAQIAIQQRDAAMGERDWAIRFRNDTKAYALNLEQQRDAVVQATTSTAAEGVPAPVQDAVVRTARSEAFEHAVRNYLRDLESLRKQLEDAQVRIKTLEQQGARNP
jgi:chaperonin cofactor prefoldin